MNVSSSRFVSVRLRNGWSSKSPPVASSSARSTSALKMTRPGVVTSRSPLHVYSIGSWKSTDRLDRELDVLLRPEPLETLHAGRLRRLLGGELLQVVLAVREEVRAEHHVLARRRERATARRREDVVRESMSTRASACASARAEVHGHLVAVEVGVERLADERMDLDRLALDEHRLERLDRGGAASARGSGAPDARR